MEFTTPKAMKKIQSSLQAPVLVNGQVQSKLQAMSFALKYHTLDVTETDGGLQVKGIVPVGS